MNYSSLRFPKKSHRKIINVPGESKELAELFGILFGDGGINNKWQLVISLNSNSDFEYAQYISKLLNSLFKIRVFAKKRPNQNTLVLVCSSINLVNFLVSKGSVRGNKVIQQIDIPNWINNNLEYQKFFVRGLVDTDGCLFIHNHIVRHKLYRNIGFCFTNSSKKLIISVAKILERLGIDPHITDKGRRIYLYSFKNVIAYLNIFGSSNPRILKKYLEWVGIKKSVGDNIDELQLENKIWRDAGVV